MEGERERYKKKIPGRKEERIESAADALQKHKTNENKNKKIKKINEKHLK